MLALVLAAALGQLPDPQPSGGPFLTNPASMTLASQAFFHPLTYSADLPACSADTGCVLDVYATSSALTSAEATLTNASANGMETAPMVSGSGTVYAATITSTAPSIAAGSVPEAVRTMWSGDNTCIFAVRPSDTSASRFILAFGDDLADGFTIRMASGGNLTAIWNGAGAQVSLNASPVANLHSEWSVVASRKSGTSYTVCVNGVCNTPTVNALAIVNPGTDDALFIGGNTAGGQHLNGAFGRGRCWNDDLSDATIHLRGAQMLKGLAVRPADTYVTTVRASAASDEYASGLVAFSGDNVRIPHPTKGLRSESASTNALFQSEDLTSATWTKGAGATATAGTEAFGVAADTATMDLLDNTGSADFVQLTTQAVTVTSSAGPFATSTYLKPNDGSSVGTVGLTCGGGVLTTACSCFVSSGTCNVSASGNDRCYAYTTATTNVRLQVITTCASARVSVIPWVYAGQYTISRDAAYFGALQLEQAAVASSYIRTTTAAVTRAADVSTVPTTGWPAAEGEIAITYTPSQADATTLQVVFDSRTTGSTQGAVIYRAANETLVCATYAAANVCQATSAAQTFTPGTAKRLECRWDASSCAIVADGAVLATAVATGSPASHKATAGVGCDQAGTLQSNGWQKDACASRPGGCP